MQSRNDFSKGNGERCPIPLLKGGYGRARLVDGVRRRVQVPDNFRGLPQVQCLNPTNQARRNKLRTL